MPGFFFPDKVHKKNEYVLNLLKVYNFLFNFLIQNDLTSPAQSGFKAGDSY